MIVALVGFILFWLSSSIHVQSWGTVSYHNAMIMTKESSEEETLDNGDFKVSSSH